MEKVRKRTIPLYALSGFGPNMLNVFVTAYLLDALLPAGLVVNRELWSFTGAAVVSMVLFPILFTVARVFDGLIDIPWARLSDRLHARTGKRRPLMLIALIPTVVAYFLMWNIPSMEVESMANTVWVAVFAIIFYCFYTLLMVSYYGTFADAVPDERARVKLSSWKSAFDTIGYSIAYALVPMFIGMGMNIKDIVMMSLPLMATMLLPQFLLKMDKEADRTPALKTEDEKLSMWQSLKLAATNKTFLLYMGMLAAYFFGLQIFLAGQNVVASGIMELEGWQIAVMNATAFAPVPIMLIIFNILYKKKGLRMPVQLAMVCFAIAMITFLVARVDFFPSVTTRLVVGVIGSVIGSFAIGAFFTIQYVYPSQIAANEIQAGGKNHASMYFAVQGLVTGVVGAISTGVVYLNVKQITAPGNETLGISIALVIVAVACMVALAISTRMPKNLVDMQPVEKKD